MDPIQNPSTEPVAVASEVPVSAPVTDAPVPPPLPSEVPSEPVVEPAVATPIGSDTPIEPIAPQPMLQTPAEPASAPVAPTSPPEHPAPPPPDQQSFVRNLIAKGREVIHRRKQKKLEKILAEIGKRGAITNNGVEQLLRVSDATATRYLAELERAGKITHEGYGRSLIYIKHYQEPAK